jgi:hypothetical protein
MLDSRQLSYCNAPADSFFGVNLSNLTSSAENRQVLKNNTNLIMQKRCMYEQNKPGVGDVAEKMEKDTNESCSITMTDLG